MARSRTSSCWARVKSAPKLFASLNLDFGAPGQSTLKSGLAMSVTLSWNFSRMRRASATSFSSRLMMFFFHMPRSSIHPMPNSRDATSQAWPKSCEISSLMMETRKGEWLSGGFKPEAGEKRDAALAACEAVMATIPARNSRRANWMGMTGSSPALRSDLRGSRQRKAQTNLHHRNLRAVAGNWSVVVRSGNGFVSGYAFGHAAPNSTEATALAAAVETSVYCGRLCGAARSCALSKTNLKTRGTRERFQQVVFARKTKRPRLKESWDVC